jgi:UDP-glucose 4-epimerase
MFLMFSAHANEKTILVTGGAGFIGSNVQRSIGNTDKLPLVGFHLEINSDYRAHWSKVGIPIAFFSTKHP